MHEPDKFLFQQPTLSRGACRQDLFPPGHFGSWSYAIWERGDVHMAGKVVFTCIFDELRGPNTWVKVSVTKIMRRTRIAERRVRSWITWLCEHGLIERRQRAGHTNQFRCAHPDDWPPDPNPLVPYPEEIEVLTPVAHDRGIPENDPSTPVAHDRGISANDPSTPVAHRRGPLSPTAGDPCRPRQDTTSLNNNCNNNNTVVGNSENSLFQDNVAVLTRIGVTTEQTVARLAATVGLTPLKLVLVALEAKSNAGGYVRRRIDAGAIDPKGGWTAQEIAIGIRRGWLCSLDGYSFEGPETEARPYPEGLSISRKGEKIGEISIARLRSLAGGPTDAQRRDEGHRRAGRQSADEDKRREDLIHAERVERWEYFNSLSIPRRKKLLQRATIEAAVKTPEAIGEIAIRMAWQERHDIVVAGMDEYPECNKE